MDYRDVTSNRKSTYQSLDPMQYVSMYTGPINTAHRYGDVQGSRPKVSMKDVGTVLNNRIEP